jgi:hypothetical protein
VLNELLIELSHYVEIKVSQLSGFVSEKTYYKHGEASLQSSIVAMAANFVGSNNIPFLQAVGQFGTRLEGGKVFSCPIIDEFSFLLFFLVLILVLCLPC